jgi:hypothetical protein
MQQVSEMKSEHQYLMLSTPPEKRTKFVALKQQYGSFFAFHGISIRVALIE